MTVQEHVAPKHSNSYELFILVLTVMSLVIMALLVLGQIGLLPLSDETLGLLTVYDNLVCVVFLIDFAYNFATTKPRSDYVIGKRGWLDLIGSIPTFGVFQFTALLRLARLSRVARIARLLGGQKKAEIAQDIVRNRGQYAAFITLLAAFMVLVSASLLVLQFESRSADANITTGGDALWWAIVTITTVGYGDFFPVTSLGRLTGVYVMFAGVGIIGALASILASILVPTPAEMSDASEQRTTEAASSLAEEDPETVQSLRQELEAIRSEIAAGRAEVAALRATLSGPAADTPG